MTSSFAPVPAVITAGGRISGAFAAAAGTEIKALVPFAGDTMIGGVIEALRQSGRVEEPIIVVGPETELQSSLAGKTVRVIAEGKTGPENMIRGLLALPEAEHDGWALLCTCDLPLLTGDAIRELIESAPDDADIVFPIVTKEEYEAQFPGSPGTYAPIGGEQYTGGSVFLVRPSAFARNRALIEKVFEARKGVLSMAKLGGFGLLLRFLTGTLTVEYVERRASELTGCHCRAVRGASPTLAADVDTLEDYDFVRRLRPAPEIPEIAL